MKTESGKKQNRTKSEAVTLGDAIDRGLWRLSLILREIAESTATKDSKVTHNHKSPSGRHKQVPGHTTRKSDK